MDRTAKLVPILGTRWLLPTRVMTAAWLVPPTALGVATVVGVRSWLWLAVVWNVAFTVPAALRWWSFRRMAAANEELRRFASDAVAAFGPFNALWLADTLPARAANGDKVGWIVSHWETTLRNLSGRHECYTGHVPGCTHHPVEFTAPTAGPLRDLFVRLHNAGQLNGLWLKLAPAPSR